MKKIVGGITVLLFALVLGTPWFVGGQVETFYNTLTQEVLKTSPAAEFKDLVYDRGWFCSTITGTIAMKGMDPEEMPVDLRFKSAVIHGPVFWSGLASGTPSGLALDKTTMWIESSADDEEMKALFAEFPVLSWTSVVGFDRNISSVFAMAAYAKTITEGETPLTIDFKGLNGTGSYHWVSKEFDVHAKLPELTVTENEDETLAINAVDLIAFKKGPETQVRYDIQEIALDSKESNIHFKLDKLYVEGSTNENEEVYNSALKLGFDSLKSNELTYAPAALHLTLENLDKASIDTLSESINNAASQSGQMGDEMLGMVVMGKMMELLPSILKRDPKITIRELNLGTANAQALTATGYAAIVGEKASQLPSMAMMLQAVDAKVETALPKEFLNTFVDLTRLMDLLNQGFIVSDGEYYKAEATVLDGHITLNGKTIM